MRANLRRSWGQFSAFYTLSENMSDDDNERDAGGVIYQNTFDLAPEYNYSMPGVLKKVPRMLFDSDSPLRAL